MVGRSSCIDLVIELTFCLVSRALRFGFAVQLLWCTFWLKRSKHVLTFLHRLQRKMKMAFFLSFSWSLYPSFQFSGILLYRCLKNIF